MGKVGTFFAYMFAIIFPLFYLAWRWLVVRPELEGKGQKLTKMIIPEKIALVIIGIGVLSALMVVITLTILHLIG